MSSVIAFFGRIVSFSNEVISEIKKTSWPNREELFGSLVIVCVVVVIFATVLGSMDGVFSHVIRGLIGS